MLQSISSVFVVYRRKTLTGSPDPTHANGTDKPCTGTYRKLIDVVQKQFARWAIICTGQYLGSHVVQLNLKVNPLIIKLSVLDVQVSIQIWEFKVIFSLYTEEGRIFLRESFQGES